MTCANKGAKNGKISRALAYVKKMYYLCTKFQNDTMRRFVILLFVGACMSMYCVPAFGWGQEGHRIIAKIAYDHLDKKAKKAVDRILGKGGMVYWSNWPDEIKSDTIYPNSHDWHYQDFEAGMSMGDICNARISEYPKEGGNLFRALDSLSAVLKAGKGDEHTLRFLIHLKGDEHCPMHMAHMSDRGGNAVKMKWFGRETNLHTVWDTKLIESQGYSYTEYAEMLEMRFASKEYNRTLLKEDDWSTVWRTYEVTSAIYDYQKTWDGNTYHYIYRWKATLESQLYIAGIRLAQLLNSMYK